MHLLQFQEKKPIGLIDLVEIDAKGIYFVLRESADVDEDGVLSEDMQEAFTVIEVYDFGTVTLVQVAPKNMDGASADVAFITNDEDPSRRCYETQYEIEARDKCRVRDIPRIFTQWMQ